MKFVVDELPYYHDFCPFVEYCEDANDVCYCPKEWSKYKVIEDNPRQCKWLIEFGLQKEYEE